MTQKTQTTDCWLYVLDTLADWEIAHVTAELNSGRFTLKDRKFNLLKTGASMTPVKTMGGISITPDRTIDEVEFSEGDILILPGADTWHEPRHAKLFETVKKLLEKNITVAAICGATAALAGAGLLDDRKHTSNDPDFLRMMCPEYRGASFYCKVPAVTDGNLITASGFGALEFAREIFRKTEAMKEETIEAWYQLFSTKEAKYFFSLMESLK
ncbi:MAG: DJ-1/PfpI family protein [Spirochaetes bacterium]|nr:DJ-1/PfpI family protein [Spirochaetota bacterium]